MKVKFNCNSGANIHSNREEILDIEKDLNFSIDEWVKMSENEKQSIAEDWANEKLEIWYEEIEE